MFSDIIQRHGKLIFYDENEMQIYNCIVHQAQIERKTIKIADVMSTFYQLVLSRDGNAVAEITLIETPAELDPTTMKRIAKYNAEKEVEAVNEKIKDANKRLEELECELTKKQEKLDFIQTLTDMIIKDKNFTKERYVPRNDDDDDYYD